MNFSALELKYDEKSFFFSKIFIYVEKAVSLHCNSKIIIMKAIKDKIVMDDTYYFVLSYLHTTDFAPIRSRGICKFDEITGHPIFKMDMLDYATYIELLHEGMNWMLSKSKDLTLENIVKFKVINILCVQYQ